TYQIFPVLGLIAFSLMWSQYTLGTVKQIWLKDLVLRTYYRWTGYIVLLAIILHPGLLAYQRARDGFGPPPDSFKSYVAPSLAWLTLVGMSCLLIFLAFELRRWFRKYSWWRFMNYLVDLAMLAIFYHALELGTQTHISWYRDVWWFYGGSLVAILAHKYFSRIAWSRQK
ncbi:MAG TPA: ferric reductase-like transmembrane domain-containing protein, partial [Candidatus Saccharimonadales bacterium]|nr:ferric reductase-like transmembrane domain-containing protein [Candidatus Saccharimonadales bacterium]